MPVIFYNTQRGILNDHIVGERHWGIDAGLAWRMVADASVVYIDRGISPGMRYGIAAAKTAGIPVEHRTLTYGGCINVPSAQGGGVTDARSNPQSPRPESSTAAGLFGARPAVVRLLCSVCVFVA